jgi:ABC-2 type transport system ATP-binding protein
LGSLTDRGRVVRARGLGFRYPGGRVGLESLELEVAAGEVVALLGPNGSGKSTLLRLLATDLRPTSGTLELLGVPAEPPGPALRRRIGYAPDDPVHLPPLTGEENLRFFTRLAGADPEDPGLGLAALVQTFDLSGVSGTPVGQYSFGMRRKLLLAEALAPRPELLLLDEPTVGLDPRGIDALGALLGERARDGTAVVLATNEIREAPLWAHRILFLHQGQVLADASPKTLLARLQGRTLIRVTLEGEGIRGEEGTRTGLGMAEGEARDPLEGLGALGGYDPLEELGSLEGVETWRFHPEDGGSGRIEVETRMGGRVLPSLLQHLLDAGIGVRELQVREPDLGDLFRELTGVELEDRP